MAIFYNFITARRIYASAVLGVVSLSVRHTRALWQSQTMHSEYFDTTRKSNYYCFDTNSGW